MRRAALGLEREETVAVIRQQRADDAMLRHPGLEIDDARSLGAAGAARDLMQQLKRALRRAQITAFETEIGIDDADQGQKREVMTLRDHLRADKTSIS